MKSFIFFSRSASFLLLTLGMTLPCLATYAKESVPQERTLLDWQEQVGSDHAKAPSSEIYFSARRGAKPVIVDSSTTPPSPFSSGSVALHVPPSGNTDETVAIFFNPFLYQPAPPKGWIAVEFQVNDAILTIGLGADSTNMESVATMAKNNDGKQLFTAFFVPEGNKPILLVCPGEREGEETQRFSLSSGITTGEPHVLRISWDWTSDTPGIQFQLDGETLSIKGGNEILPVDIKSLRKGIDKLSIFVGSGDFLGKVTASE